MTGETPCNGKVSENLYTWDGYHITQPMSVVLYWWPEINYQTYPLDHRDSFPNLIPLTW